MPVETRKRKALVQAALENGEPEPPTPTSATKRQKKLPVRSKDDGPEAQTPSKSKSNIITFDDDGNADKAIAIPTPKRTVTSEPVEQEDSDSDEAPEAVSTAKVADEMKKSVQAEKKAAQEQAAAEKKKRQQRDALFKQQAAQRKEAEPTEVVVPRQQSGRKRAKVDVPSLLPAEFLTDSESEEDEMESSAGDRPRKRNVSGIEKRMAKDGRGPRDEVIGSTVYRVSKKVDERLAPKVKKHSQSSKDLLLRRGRAPVKAGSGFFKR